MINVYEAYESTLNTGLVDWAKMSFFAGLVYYSYYLFSTSQMDLFYYVGGATAYLLLVFMLCVLNNVRNGQNYVLPKFLSSQFIVMCLLSLISVVPFVALLIWGGFKILSLDILTVYPGVLPICTWIVWIIVTGIAFLVVMVFGKTGNPLSVLNFVLISKYSFDVLPHLVLVTIVMAIFNTLVLGMIGYLFWVFLSLDNPFFIAICSYALVINVVALGSCRAQIEYEVVPREEKEHII